MQELIRCYDFIYELALENYHWISYDISRGFIPQ
jgi:hypothetical protein